MKRVARWMLNGLTGLSLLLCVATAGLWVRSEWVWDGVMRNKGVTTVLVAMRDGKVEFERVVVPRYALGNGKDAADNVRWTRIRWHPGGGENFDPAHWEPPTVERRYGGIHYLSGSAAGIFNYRCVMVPIGMVMAFLGAVPASRLVARGLRKSWVRRRQRLRLCVACGYDVRATPERCPECGRPVVA